MTERIAVPTEIKTIIFDPSEVLISGLLGVEERLSVRLGQPPAKILSALGGDRLIQLFQGKLSEETFLDLAIREGCWKITLDELKQAIRSNFERKVAGMEGLLRRLAEQYELVLVSDHAKEWVQHIHELHPHLGIFPRRIYSFETGRVKQEPVTFERLLESIHRRSDECVFIDDNSVNVECARKNGIFAFQFTDAAALRNDLEGAGLLLSRIPN